MGVGWLRTQPDRFWWCVVIRRRHDGPILDSATLDLIRHISNPYSHFISMDRHHHHHHHNNHRVIIAAHIVITTILVISTSISVLVVKMSNEEITIDDPQPRDEQRKIARLHRREENLGRIFAAGFGVLALIVAARTIITSTGGGPYWYNAAASFSTAVHTTTTSTSIGLSDAAASSVGAARAIITSTRTGAYNAAATFVGTARAIITSTGSGTYGAVASFVGTTFQLWHEFWLALGDGLRGVGSDIANFASSLVFGKAVLLECFQDSPGLASDLDRASPHHWSRKIAPATKGNWNVESTCDASSVPKSCPSQARCAKGLVVDCQATDKTGLFAVSQETYADCVLSPKGQTIVGFIQSQLIDLAVEGKCDGLTSGSGSDNYKPVMMRSKDAAPSISEDGFIEVMAVMAQDPATVLYVETLQVLAPYLDPDIVEYVPGSSIGIAPTFAKNHLDEQLPSSCRQQLDQITKSIQGKIIDLSVLHRCKGSKGIDTIDHVEDDGSIYFSVDGLVKAFAKDPDTTDTSSHTFHLAIPYFNKDVIEAKTIAGELYVGLTTKFVEDELGQHLPLPCWFPDMVLGFVVSAVSLCWAAVTLCTNYAWEHPKFVAAILAVCLAIRNICMFIEKKFIMPIATSFIYGWVREELEPLNVGDSRCKRILRDEIGARRFRFHGFRYLPGTRAWFYRAWIAFQMWFDESNGDTRFATQYIQTPGFQNDMPHWVRVQ